MSLVQRQSARIRSLADELGVEARALVAVLQVEAAGEGLVAGRPIVRLEVHHLQSAVELERRPQVDAVFRVLGPNRYEGHEWRPHPSAPWIRLHQPGAGGQAIEWTALQAARVIDAAAADESTSWGAGQVLGSEWRNCGYRSVDELVSAQATEAGQLDTFARYLRAHELLDELVRHDWYGFARTYNGLGKAEAYAAELAEAFARS